MSNAERLHRCPLLATSGEHFLRDHVVRIRSRNIQGSRNRAHDQTANQAQALQPWGSPQRPMTPAMTGTTSLHRTSCRCGCYFVDSHPATSKQSSSTLAMCFLYCRARSHAQFHHDVQLKLVSQRSPSLCPRQGQLCRRETHPSLTRSICH